MPREMGQVHRLSDRAADFRELLAPGAIRAVFQPIVRLSDLQPIGYEGLARFPTPPGLVALPPDVTLAAAARSGLRHELEVACWAAMTAAGEPPDRRLLFVNVAPDALGHPGLAKLADQLPQRLVIELTEQDAVQDIKRIQERLKPWIARGALFRSLRLPLERAIAAVEEHLAEVESAGGLASLLWHPNAAAEERFKLVANPKELDSQLQIFGSPDGVHWRHSLTNVVTYNTSVKPHHLDSQNVIFWDERIDKYVAYFRKNVREPGSQGRMVARCEAERLGHFCRAEEAPVVLQADPEDVVRSRGTRQERIALPLPTRVVVNRAEGGPAGLVEGV